MFDFSQVLEEATEEKLQEATIEAMPKIVFASTLTCHAIKKDNKLLKALDDKNLLDAFLHQAFKAAQDEPLFHQIVTIFAKRELVTADMQTPDEGFEKVSQLDPLHYQLW